MTIEYGVNILQQHLMQDMTAKAMKLLNTPDSIKRIINPLIPYDIKTKFNNYCNTSSGICYGDALEQIVNVFFASKGATVLAKNTIPGKDCDCLFRVNDKTILIEMKVRDDHDSTKKVGQVMNLKEKLDYLTPRYPNVEGIMWFVDPTFTKNETYYKQQVDTVLYGRELENYLVDIFTDDRCNGLFDYLVEVTISYNINQQNTYIDCLNIDYHTLTSMQIRGIVNNRYLYKDAVNFFLGDVSTSELLAYIRTLPRYQSAKEVIDILEGYERDGL